jgi:hypothetical protein
MEHKKHKDGIITNILVLRSENDGYFYDRLMKMLGSDYPIITFSSQMSEYMKIIEYELWVNHMLLQYVERTGIN